MLADVHRYSLLYLPSRQWNRVLVVGEGAADAALLLAERGYDVALADAPDSELLLAEHGIAPAVDAGGDLGAVVLGAVDDAATAVRRVRSRLRPGGRVLACSGEPPRLRGFARTNDLGAPSLRRRGRLGLLL